MLYSLRDAIKQERKMKRVRVAMQRGWRLKHTAKGHGLVDPGGDEFGYQLYDTSVSAWMDGAIAHRVLFWDERLMLAFQHIKLAYHALFRRTN